MKKVILFILALSYTSLYAASYWEMKKEVHTIYKSGDKVRAFKILDRYIASNPKEYKAKNLAAVLYYWDGENAKAKKILEELLAETTYPEAGALLARINVKLGTSSKMIAKQEDKRYKAVKLKNRRADSTDLEYLLAKVEKNPHDIENRILLSKFYFKIEDYQKSYDLAHEALQIDPSNAKMQKIVSHLEKKYKLTYSAAIDEESAVDKRQAKEMLRKLYGEKNYNAYYNMYEALKNAKVTFSQEEYINILHVAVMVEKYHVAQAIIDKGVLPQNKYTIQVQQLLSQKLATRKAEK